MAQAEFPAPTEGFVITHFLVVEDQDRARDWYERVLGARTVLERDPEVRCYMRDPDGHLIEVGQTTGVG
ncbi:MAG: VOC family protein [Actinomycetota bacterium]